MPRVGKMILQILQGPLLCDSCLGPEAQACQHGQPPIPHLPAQICNLKRRLARLFEMQTGSSVDTVNATDNAWETRRESLKRESSALLRNCKFNREHEQ